MVESKMFKIILMMALALASQSSFAQSAPFKKIASVATAFATATGCQLDEVDARLVTKFSDKGLGIENAYIAVVASDLNCMGGSGTGSMNLYVLKTADGRPVELDSTFEYLKVVPTMSAPVAKSNAPTRALTSIYQRNGQLFATGLEYGPEDTNCCPSLKTIYSIKLQKKIVALSKEDSRDLYSWVYTKVKNY